MPYLWFQTKSFDTLRQTIDQASLMEQITPVLASVGVLQALMLCAFLLSRKQGHRLANLLLAVVLLGLSIRIGKSVFHHYFEVAAWQRNLGLSGLLLVGPGYWLYYQVVSSGQQSLLSRQYAHFVPFCLFAALAAVIPNDYTGAAYASYTMVMLHLVLYLLFALWHLYAIHEKRLHETQKRWLIQLGTGIGALWALYASVSLGWVPYYIGGALVYSFLITIMTLHLLNHTKLPNEKYLRSRHTQDARQTLLQRAEDVLVKQQLYLDVRLRIDTLATHLSVTARELSEAINQTHQQSFSAWVNSFRIRHACQLLENPDTRHQKLAAIAYDSGFGNITSFNHQFKAMMSLTPSDYRRSKTQ